jgi:tRNA(Ile)-lysidine synthase
VETVKESALKYIRAQRLLQPGERIAVAVSGGADSVALLRVLLELQQELGVVLSAAHFHHQIRGSEADADQHFVADLAHQFELEFHSGSADVPAYARESKLSLESAARELRHRWFLDLVEHRKADRIATAHTLDDQAETVLMRILRGTGVRGLAGIAPEHRAKHLIRPLLCVSRAEVESYLKTLQQPWRSDSTNLDLSHTRNRVRHTLLPLLEKEFNPAIRSSLAELAEMARMEDDYWRKELDALLPRLIRQGKPTRSGRINTGIASNTLALDLNTLKNMPPLIQAMFMQATAQKLGATLEFKHIQALTELVLHSKADARLSLPNGLTAHFSLRELGFSLEAQAGPENYRYSLSIPGEIYLPELARTIRTKVISDGKQKLSGYNRAWLLNRTLLAGELTVRNWRAGDRFFPAHSQSPKKVKELLQPSRLGKVYSPAERKLWPVIESAGEIVWVRGFPVAHGFAVESGEAVLIEEIGDDS